MRRPVRVLLAPLAVALALAGCTPGGTVPTPTSTPSAPQRPFTVMTTERPGTFDPAATTTAADAIVALNTFGRLMIVHAEKGELKPDLATDCLYTSPTSYECELRKDLTFHNGHALTASDVKFSIERAYRLGVARSSTALLDSLQRVEVVNDQTVRFTLRWADTQFGYALASPAASIVDEEIYDPDAVRSNEGQAIGAGPYKLVTTAADQLVFERFLDYKGADTGVIDTIRVAFAPDSPSVEKAMAEGSTDAVWRSLTPAAVERLAAEAAGSPDRTTKGGFTRQQLPAVRVHRLVWNPDSPARAEADVRQVVALSLQADRTLASLVPSNVAGAVDAFPVGGQPEVPQLPGHRGKLTLGYSSLAPGQADRARLLRDRIESQGGISVQLLPDTDDTDLFLTDRSGWLNTAVGWLQVYTDNPLPGSAAKLAELSRRARETPDPAQRQTLLAEVQQQAAADLTVLPIAQEQETLYLGRGVTLQGDPFGPGYQLGLWSFRR